MIVLLVLELVFTDPTDQVLARGAAHALRTARAGRRRASADLRHDVKDVLVGRTLGVRSLYEDKPNMLKTDVKSKRKMECPYSSLIHTGARAGCRRRPRHLLAVRRRQSCGPDGRRGTLLSRFAGRLLLAARHLLLIAHL